MRQQSYFGIASLLLELVSLIIFGSSIVANHGANADFLLASIPSLLVIAVLQGYLPVAGALAGIIGFVVDQQKMFSVLGLALCLIILVLSFIAYPSNGLHRNIFSMIFVSGSTIGRSL